MLVLACAAWCFWLTQQLAASAGAHVHAVEGTDSIPAVRRAAAEPRTDAVIMHQEAGWCIAACAHATNSMLTAKQGILHAIWPRRRVYDPGLLMWCVSCVLMKSISA